MGVATDLLLLTTDPASGRCLIGPTECDAVLGGAFLADLVALDRVELAGEGRRARVAVTDDSPLASPALEAALDRIRGRKPAKAQSVVTRLGKRARDTLYAELTRTGGLRRREAKLLGIIPLTRHTITDPSRRSDLLARVRGVLLHDQPADATVGPLVALLSAGDLVKLVVDKPDRKRAKARAEEVAEGDWAGEAVAQAVRAARTAMTAALAATAAGGAVAGS